MAEPAKSIDISRRQRGKHLSAAGLDDRMRGIQSGGPQIVAYFSRMLPLSGGSGKSEAPPHIVDGFRAIEHEQRDDNRCKRLWPWSKLENAANDAAFRAHRSPIDRHSMRAGDKRHHGGYFFGAFKAERRIAYCFPKRVSSGFHRMGCR